MSYSACKMFCYKFQFSKNTEKYRYSKLLKVKYFITLIEKKYVHYVIYRNYFKPLFFNKCLSSYIIKKAINIIFVSLQNKNTSSVFSFNRVGFHFPSLKFLISTMRSNPVLKGHKHSNKITPIE